MQSATPDKTRYTAEEAAKLREQGYKTVAVQFIEEREPFYLVDLPPAHSASTVPASTGLNAGVS